MFFFQEHVVPAVFQHNHLHLLTLKGEQYFQTKRGNWFEHCSTHLDSKLETGVNKFRTISGKLI